MHALSWTRTHALQMLIIWVAIVTMLLYTLNEQTNLRALLLPLIDIYLDIERAIFYDKKLDGYSGFCVEKNKKYSYWFIRFWNAFLIFKHFCHALIFLQTQLFVRKHT